MRLALMQPYFLPYIGYFQLMATSDKFILHDKIEYSKGGWVNRNRAFADEMFTIPLAKHSDNCPIGKLQIADSWPEYRAKLLRKMRSYYIRATNYHQAYELIEKILFCPKENLFKFIYDSLLEFKEYLCINTTLMPASQIFLGTDELRGAEMVKATCQKMFQHSYDDHTYVNAIGGQELYNKEDFAESKIDLKFIKTRPITYRRGNNSWIPYLSILDLIMYNHREETIDFLGRYNLI